MNFCVLRISHPFHLLLSLLFRAYFIVEPLTSHARSIASSANRSHTCTVMRRRKTSGPSERNELSLNARGSIHSASVAQEVHSAGSYAADRPRVVHRSARMHDMPLRGVYLHTGSAIGADTGIEKISSLRRGVAAARNRAVESLVWMLM